MYTQCPECGTVFRVTAAVLRAAQGQVRCGVCDASFDALRFLSDDVELDVNAASASRIVGAPGEALPRAPAAPPPPPPAAPRSFGAATRTGPSADEERELGAIAAQLARAARPAAAAPAAAPPARPAPATPEPVEVNVLEPADVEEILAGQDEPAEVPESALEFDLPSDRWDQVFVRDPGAASLVPLDLELEADGSPAAATEPAAPDELVLVEEREDPLAKTDEFRVPDFAAEFELAVEAEPRRAPADVGAGAQTDAAELELEPAAIDVLDAAAAAPAPPPQGGGRPHAAATVVAGRETEPEVALEPRRPARPRAAAALAAAVLLALGLAAQLVHHFRERLAETSLVGPAVAALYARLGLPLEPRWDLTAYDVRQWGAQSEETAGVLQLRASIVNRATRAQPYPLLRVTLEDRFGAQVGRREFTPTEYLPGHTAPRALLAPGARADADLKLADPGNQAVGFELDVCLMRHGRLFCGADAKAGGG